MAAAEAAHRGDASASVALAGLAAHPQALWITSAAAATESLPAASAAAARQHKVLVAVLYALPQRDCGGASAGGLTAAAYRRLVQAIASPLGRSRAAVVLEPDALALIGCLSPAAARERYALLRDAVSVLAGAGAAVYLDAGHSGWIPAAVMAGRLRNAGIAGGRGVALNVSGYDTTESERRYGAQLASRLPGMHVVIDTSRNGRGAAPGAQWCNAPGRALGARPRATVDVLVDALLWIKHPGESDGDCGRHEPAAGVFWADYALGLLGAA
ncbi:MAG: 1,4-beta cellobiohydrolase [Frankiales bacterium]|nr:1,4-beta cellobiohydrolase [Frankiales bacterium]